MFVLVAPRGLPWHRPLMSLRHTEILQLAREEGRVEVEPLAERFGVTLQTIRRDLTDLAAAGQLTRVHGGAVLPSGTANIGWQERRSLNAAAKTRIAEAVAAMVPDGASLTLNIGTTTEAVAQALLHHRDILVMTNNMNVAQTLAANRQATVMLTGGRLRAADGGLVGPAAVEAVRGFRPDFAVIGCSAVDAAGTLLDYDPEEVAVSQAIRAHARSSLLVADAAKFRAAAPFRICGLGELDRVVTDAPLPPAVLDGAKGVDVTLV